jgi:outer membrane protein
MNARAVFRIVVCLAGVLGLLLTTGGAPGRAADPDAPPAGGGGSAAAPAPETGALRLTVHEAILTALENNRALVVERLNPSIQETLEGVEAAAFDPVLAAGASAQKSKTQRQARSGSATESADNKIYQGSLSLQNYFPTGTAVELGATTNTNDSSLYDEPFSATRLGLSVTQSLLRGLGPDVNLVRLRQARLATDISRYELRGFSEDFVARVENAYWEFALAQRRIEIVEESLRVANQQLAETEEMIQVGTMAEAEMAAVQAEVAAQQQALINARSRRDTDRLRLLRVINPPGADLWDRAIVLVHPPQLPDVELGAVADHVAHAEQMRPEINQARLQVMQGDLELVHTRNGLLPRMDLFINLGKTGYADSFGQSVDDITGDSYDAQVGVTFEFPPINRAARASHRRALLSREQSDKALDNLAQLVALDVRTAYIEVNRTREQIAASRATRQFEEEKSRVESEKFRVGRSTNLLVAQAQRDLLLSRINEVEAVVNYLNALTDFYRLEGSLLQRRGIGAPGADPVDPSRPPY